jgi:hypothetical protein
MKIYKEDVINMMRLKGGSFVKALAEAFATADATNFMKLRRCFMEEWQKYTVFVVRKIESEQPEPPKK